MYSASGKKNPNWKGGRFVGSNGYIKVLVGIGHPMADSKGYAYEHRMVAEEMLGRKLAPGEIVHHINGIKSDNRPENIKVTAGISEHRSFHRKRNDLKPLEDTNPMRECACGCGGSFYTYDKENRPRNFIWGHNARLQKKKGGKYANK